MESKKSQPQSKFETSEPIPEGSQFDKYVKSCQALLSQELVEEVFQKFEALLKGIFRDIMHFLTDDSPRLAIQLQLIYSNDQFEQIVQGVDNNPKIIKPSKAKIPIYAFVLDNGILSTININVGGLVLLGSSPALIFNYVACVGHEINHILYHSKSEQEIHNVDVPFLEKFLGCKLPEEFKNLKTSDYSY